MRGDYTSNKLIAINKTETLAGAPSRQILATYPIEIWGSLARDIATECDPAGHMKTYPTGDWGVRSVLPLASGQIRPRKICTTHTHLWIAHVRIFFHTFSGDTQKGIGNKNMGICWSMILTCTRTELSNS